MASVSALDTLRARVVPMPPQPWSHEEYIEALLSDIENDYLGLWEVSHGELRD